jgi:hypothetical protein
VSGRHAAPKALKGETFGNFQTEEQFWRLGLQKNLVRYAHWWIRFHFLPTRSPSFESFRPSLFVVTFLCCLFNLGLFANCKSFKVGFARKKKNSVQFTQPPLCEENKEGLLLCHAATGALKLPPSMLQAERDYCAKSHGTGELSHSCKMLLKFWP